MTNPVQYGVAILDTNLLDCAFKPKTKDMAATVLASVSRRYTPVVSEYLRFEIYRGLEMQRVPAAKAVVDSFTAYKVDKATLDTAAALKTCYDRDENTRSRRDSFSDGDIILAATAFLNKFILVTGNRGDFPAPYFVEVGEHKLQDKKGKTWAFYELKPDLVYLNGMLDICYPRTPF
jgi:predicted nucleic acid-binding protein